MSENNKENIVEMPKGNDDEATEPVEMTPEEIEAKQKEAQEAADKSRLIHLEALRMNPYVLRDTFQKQILNAIVSGSTKVKAMCEAYCRWAEVMSSNAPNFIDTTEVQDQTVPIIERYGKTIENNSLVVTAIFQKTIQDVTIESETAKAIALIDALDFWMDGESLSTAFT